MQPSRMSAQDLKWGWIAGRRENSFEALNPMPSPATIRIATLECNIRRFRKSLWFSLREIRYN